MDYEKVLALQAIAAALARIATVLERQQLPVIPQLGGH